MLMTIIGVILGIAAGSSNVISRNINAILAKKIGLLESTFFNYVTGLLGAGLMLLISGEFLKFSFKAAYSISALAYLGGLLGVVVVAASSFVTPKIAAFYLTILMFIGQLFAGVVIDYAAEGIFSISKIVGGVFVVVGLVITLKADIKKPVAYQEEQPCKQPES